MADPRQVLEQTGLYWAEDQVGDFFCQIGYKKEFRWSWLATQLNTFVIIGQTEEVIDNKLIAKFSARCHSYALKNHQGWPLGLQSGVGAIAILQGRQVTEEAVRYCLIGPERHFGSFEIPVIHNLTSNEVVRFAKAPYWGKLFYPYFGKMIDLVAAQL
jgi:hypothetical protein